MSAKERILEADRLIIGSAAGPRTEISAEEIRMLGPDGKLRLLIRTGADGISVDLFTPACDWELDGLVSIGALDGHTSVMLGRPERGNPSPAVLISSAPGEGPRLAMFDSHMETLFEAPGEGILTLEDELSARLAETARAFMAERGCGDVPLRNALQYVPKKLRRMRDAGEAPKGGQS